MHINKQFIIYYISFISDALCMLLYGHFLLNWLIAYTNAYIIDVLLMMGWVDSMLSLKY